MPEGRYRKIAALLLASGAAAFSAPANAVGTAAGTVIDNTATATYTPPGGGGDVSVPSNTISLKVDELLDVTIASADPGDVVSAPAATGQVTSFNITNTGNGPEAFTLSATAAIGGDDFDPSVTSLVIDANGNGVYDAGVDTIYVTGSNDPVLTPDASITIFVLSTIPGGAADGNRAEIRLNAAANTGTGAPGTSFAGAGQGGGDAVVGSTGADGVDNGFYLVQAAAASLVKSAVVLDPFGGSKPVPGATITYTLVATVTGSGSLANLRISDPIPAGTSYAATSLTLQGSPLSDAADSDGGEFTGTGINVRLGSIPGGQTRSVSFQVKID